MISIQKIIDDKIAADNAAPHISSGKWSPSSFGYCFRKQYWQKTGEPKSNPPDARTLRVFRCGNLFEQFVVSCLDGNCQRQVLVENDYVKGYADLVFDDIVWDIKSQHSKAFWYMTKKKDYDVKKDKYHNWLQVMDYGIELKKPQAGLCFISKDDLCVQQYVLPVSDYWKDEVNAEICILMDIKELPLACPRCFIQKDGTSKECQYCDWRDKCKELEGKDK